MLNYAALECDKIPTSDELNMKLKTFEVLVQARIAPHSFVLNAVNHEVRSDSWPREYWRALLDGLKGQGFAELTSLEIYRTETWIGGKRFYL